MKCIIILLFLLSATTNGHHILGIFPHAAYSHHVLQSSIMNGLLGRGHSIVSVGYFRTEIENPNFTQLILPQINLLTNAIDLTTFLELDRSSLRYKYNDFQQLIDRGHADCKILLNSSFIEEIFKIHYTTPFDVLVTEALNTDCTLGIAYRLNIKFVALSPCALMPWHYDRVELPDFPSFIPNEFVGYSEVMGFKERFLNWIIVKSFKYLYRKAEDVDTALLRKRFGDDIPNLRDISRNTSVLFVNQYYTMSGARPLPPGVVEVGGLHIKDRASPLPKDLKRILDNASDGVILFSWGSVLRGDSLPIEIRNSIIRVFSRLPQMIIWKFESDNLTNLPPNIMIMNWIPQRDLLCHPNIKLFMTHGGQLGINEAVYCSVPMIITPIFGDTFLNAASLVHRQVGVLLDFEEINETTLTKALDAAMKPTISQNMQSLSYTFRHRLSSPLNTTLWWIEHIITATGHNKFTKSYAIELNWFTYHSYDIITLLLVILICTLIIIIYLFKLIVLGVNNFFCFKKIK